MFSTLATRVNLPLEGTAYDEMDFNFALLSETEPYATMWENIKGEYELLGKPKPIANTIGSFLFGAIVAPPSITPFIHNCILPENIERPERNETIILLQGPTPKLLHKGTNNLIRIYFYSTKPVNFSVDELLIDELDSSKSIELYVYKNSTFKLYGKRSLPSGKKSVSFASQDVVHNFNKLPGERLKSIDRTNEQLFLVLGVLTAIGICLVLIHRAR